ncbi:DUF1906 domain-containing protein [Acuticoccus mangrovi]|uniref:DUF1906 domain-containing protein n=1 Tax=Acuticoccus mangrovi TaxID=2796142 RepID=A0A934IQJ6_9HYPH|nr:DUF1906 domain-containing protein [Acuticoccus mangrovi]MBJ3776220.1 DUF1906 domain-containing protein [Acuticoccus mangrovi]
MRLRSLALAALLLTLVAAAAPARAADPRAAIIDAAWDTRPFLDDLEAVGVQVIGRYLARCPQPERNIPEKRLIDQGPASDRNSEVSQILAHNMAILSIYQYNNDSKNKFHGKDRDGNPLPDAACRITTRERTPTAEAELDARAAVTQANALGQPRGTAIYFGVDIAFNAADTTTRAAMVDYFRTVGRILSRSGYRLGAYGNGDALEVLQAERLIDYAWLSASRAYPGTTSFHNSGRWHLFQSGVNLEWFGGDPGSCRRGLPLDVNIKNARFADGGIGIWTRRGAVMVDPTRTRAIYDARRFACDGDARIRRTARSGPRDLISANQRCRGGRTVSHPDTVDYANAARVGRTAGDVVEVDHDDDGTFDGWTARSNLTPSFSRKPAWIFSSAERGRAHCP